MKVLFLTEFFPQDVDLIYTGGVEVRTFQVAQKAKKDFSVKVISRPSQLVPATWLSVFARLCYLFTSFFKALFTDFDLIEGSNFVTYLPAFFAGKIKRKPVIAWIADVLGKDWFQFGFFVGSFGYLVEKISLKLNWTHIIALSQSTKAKLIKAGISAAAITVVSGGIDPHEFNQKPVKKYSSFTIICIARLVETKRVIDLVQAFAQTVKHHPRTRLIIIGHGPKKQSLIKQVNHLNLSGKVSFFANLTRKELLNKLSASHILCLPSVVEGFGLVTIEAFAAGLPAVLTDIIINHEVTHDQGAVFFKPKDTQDLAKKIIHLINSSKLYNQKKNQAQKIAKLYTWDKIYQQTKQVYENCIIS